MAAVPVKHPDEARVPAKGGRRGEGGGVVVPPEAAGAAKGGQAGRGREPGAAEGEDAPAGAEDLVEGVHVGAGRHDGGG